MAYGARECFMKEIVAIFVIFTFSSFCRGEVEVTTAAGKFKGAVIKHQNTRLYAFKGITYAQSSTRDRYRVAKVVRNLASVR